MRPAISFGEAEQAGEQQAGKQNAGGQTKQALTHLLEASLPLVKQDDRSVLEIESFSVVLDLG
jgi:hypothetical protein